MSEFKGASREQVEQLYISREPCVEPSLASASGKATVNDPAAAGTDCDTPGADPEAAESTGERQSQQRQAPQQRWSEERQAQESAPLRPAAAWGQRGLKGRHLTQVAEPDHVIVHRLTDCPRCQAKLEAESANMHEKIHQASGHHFFSDSSMLSQ